MKNQNDNQVQKRSTGSNVLIAVLILIMLATSAFGIFAWARYQTSVQGEGTAQVAKWNFKVTGDKTQTEQIAFPVTRTDENTTVAIGTMAPGTYGEIPMEIDVTGTQTDLMYTISGSTVNMPRNLKLYADAARTEEIVVLNQQLSKGNYLKVADIGTETKIISETIYWEWPFETGTTEEDKQFNNQIDTEDMGKTMTMAITVEGKQLNDKPLLADIVQVGDYVNYDADSNGTQTFTSDDHKDLLGTSISATISTANDFDTNAKAQWRVLSVNRQTKEIELVSVEPTAQTITLSAIDGYANAETILNNIGKIYDNGKGAKIDSGRSINLADIEQYSSYDKTTYINNDGYIVGTSSKSYEFKTPGNVGVNLEGTEMQKLTGSSENPVTVNQTFYTYKTQNYFKSSIIYNMIFSKNDNKMYWVNAKSINLFENYCNFGLSVIATSSENAVNMTTMYTTSGHVYDRIATYVPVVELEDNIQTTGKDANGVWQLDI